MNIKDQVFAGLDASGVPSWFGAYKETDEYPTPPPCYVVFTTMSIPNAYADDAITQWRHLVYLEMWSGGPYETQKAAIVVGMAASGFAASELRDGYEPDTKSNHMSATFVFDEDVI